MAASAVVRALACTAALAGAGPPAFAGDTPQETYATWCGRCHQFDGKGIPGVYPPLDGSAIVVGDAKLLARLVLDGGFPNNAMPAFRDVLTQEQAAAILSYLRTAWSNRAPPVTSAVIAERATP